MKLNSIYTKKAPDAVGPYSQAILAGDMLFTSGQIPIDPETGELITEIDKATHQVFANLKAVLDEAGFTLDNVVKALVFLKDMEDFATVNEIYGEYFKDHKPARSCVEVAKLPKDAIVEIEVIAHR